MMVTPVQVDILHLQMQTKMKSAGLDPSVKKTVFTEKDLANFKQNLLGLLGNKKLIEISNQATSKSKESGFFLLKLNQQGIFLFESKSLKRTHYAFSFQKNELEVNKRPVSNQLLPDFIKRIEDIASKVKNGECQVIES